MKVNPKLTPKMLYNILRYIDKNIFHILIAQNQ